MDRDLLICVFEQTKQVLQVKVKTMKGDTEEEQIEYAVGLCVQIAEAYIHDRVTKDGMKEMREDLICRQHLKRPVNSKAEPAVQEVFKRPAISEMKSMESDSSTAASSHEPAPIMPSPKPKKRFYEMPPMPDSMEDLLEEGLIKSCYMLPS